MSELRSFLPVLEKLRATLIKSKNDAQATVIEKLIDIIDNDSRDSFNKYLNSVDMWGGAGAVWEVYISNPKENREFQQEIINLINLMQIANITNGKTKSVKRYFQKELGEI